MGERELRGKCQVCAKTNVDSRCSWCRQVFYCSREHQLKDWETHKESCTRKKYEIDTNDLLGRHLVATEDLKPETILFKERPLLLALKAYSTDFTPNKLCVGCYKEILKEEETSEDSEEDDSDDEEEEKACPKCGLSLCSTECGAGHHFHRTLECRLLAEAPPFDKVFPGGDSGKNFDVRDTLVQNLPYVRALLLKAFHASQWDALCTLQCDSERRTAVHHLERTTRVYTVLKKLLEHINHPLASRIEKPDVHKILGLIDINALHFQVFGEVEVTAIFPTFSLLEHNCLPNTRFYIAQNSSKPKYGVELWARTALKVRKGEGLAVSYVNLMWNTEKRREYLRKERGFWCGCKRCEDPTELGSNFSTIVCLQEGCSGNSVPLQKPPPSSDLYYSCLKCSSIASPTQIKRLDNRLCEMVTKTPNTLPEYKSLLSKVHLLVHPDYYLCFVLGHSLVQLYGEKDADNPSEDENVRMHNSKMLEDKVALCNRLIATIRRLDPGLAKLNIYIAVVYYEMQSAILAMGGGEVDDDFFVLKSKPETVKLAKLYLQRCLDCFKYEFLEIAENKLKNLAKKKMEYLDFILNKFCKIDEDAVTVGNINSKDEVSK